MRERFSHFISSLTKLYTYIWFALKVKIRGHAEVWSSVMVVNKLIAKISYDFVIHFGIKLLIL